MKMAPELEDYWFERRGAGWCSRTRTTSWKGWVLTGLYSAIVTAAALLLAERTIIGFVAILVVASTAFLLLVASKTRGGLWGDRIGRI